MARDAKRSAIVDCEAKFRILRERFDVVRMEIAAATAAEATRMVIAYEYSLAPQLVFPTLSYSMIFRRQPALPVRMPGSLPGLTHFYSCFFGEFPSLVRITNFFLLFRRDNPAGCGGSQLRSGFLRRMLTATCLANFSFVLFGQSSHTFSPLRLTRGMLATSAARTWMIGNGALMPSFELRAVTSSRILPASSR